MDGESGVDFVALVDNPAIDGIGFGSGLFFAFAKEVEKQYNFKATSLEKQIVSGPLMIPDAPIYRNDSHGEYMVEFSADSIYNIVKKFFKNQNTSNVNRMHQATDKVGDVYMIESFLIDRSRMAPPVGFEELPDGSWFGSYKVDNTDVWNQIKEGKFKGFSIEGMFIPESMSDEQLMAEIESQIIQ